MKFMLFATGALAATQFNKRQVSVVTNAISEISAGTTELDNGIKSFSTAVDAVALQETADKLIATINTQNGIVGGLSPLGNDAASLATPIQNLGKLVQTTVADLKSKKQAFADAGVAGIVYDKAVSLQSAAKTFTSTTLSKVPASLQPLGNTLAQPIADALADAVSSFQEYANGGGAATTGGASATTAAPTSGAAATTTGGSAAPTSSGPAATTGGASAATTTRASATPTYTGAAVANVAGMGAVAAAVVAALL